MISPDRRRARWLRRAAAVILVLGIFGADLLYWLETRSPQAPNPLPEAGEDKAATRQAETIMGKQTVVLEQWENGLHRPVTQAGILVVTAALAAGGCFYGAHLHERAANADGEPGP